MGVFRNNKKQPSKLNEMVLSSKSDYLECIILTVKSAPDIFLIFSDKRDSFETQGGERAGGFDKVGRIPENRPTVPEFRLRNNCEWEEITPRAAHSAYLAL